MSLDVTDHELIRLTMVELTSSASLDRSPKKNWVENSGNLPPYVRKLARAIEKDGKTLSQAIAIAISRIKKWAAGGDDVDADTQAKAAKALGQWEALKAKNASKKVSLSRREDGTEFLMLSNVGNFNVQVVRNAWEALTREKRQKFREAHPNQDAYEAIPYSYIRELWTTYIIVETEGIGNTSFVKIPYTVKKTEVTFGDPVPVEQVWKDEKGELTKTEKGLLKDILTLEK